MNWQRSESAGVVVALLLVSVLLASACGSQPAVEPPATVTGTVPAELLPIMLDGNVLVSAFAAGGAADSTPAAAAVATTTSASGRFRLDIPPGTYVIRASCNEVERASEPFTTRAGVTVEVQFTAGSDPTEWRGAGEASLRAPLTTTST